MQKVKNRKWILVTFIVLAIVVISIVAANIIIVSITKSNSNRNANLLQNGPWSDEGIWKDSDSSLYLICSKTESEPYAEVTAYVFVTISGFSTIDDDTKQSFEANAEFGSSTGVDKTYLNKPFLND